MLSKEASSTISKVFGMTRPRTEPRSPGPLANTLTIMPMSDMKNLIDWIIELIMKIWICRVFFFFINWTNQIKKKRFKNYSMSCFHTLYVNCLSWLWWILLGNSELCIWFLLLLLLLTPFNCYFLFVYRSCKEIKEKRKKRWGYF